MSNDIRNEWWKYNNWHDFIEAITKADFNVTNITAEDQIQEEINSLLLDYMIMTQGCYEVQNFDIQNAEMDIPSYHTYHLFHERFEVLKNMNKTHTTRGS